MTVFEAELTRIADVLAVRSVPLGEGVGEIHVLAAPGRNAQEIASDVRSLALLRGVELSDDGIHVVQLQPSRSDEPVDSDPGLEPATEVTIAPVDAPASRVEVDGVVVVSDGRSARASATVRRGGRAATGTAVFVAAGPALRRGVAEATLGGVLDLLDAKDEMAVDTAVVLTLPPHEVALVTIAVVGGHDEETLIGAVLVRNAGVNDAIARAVLDATNRWFSRPDGGAA